MNKLITLRDYCEKYCKLYVKPNLELVEEIHEYFVCPKFKYHGNNELECYMSDKFENHTEFSKNCPHYDHFKVLLELENL